VVCQADDWLQMRGDAFRSGASRDKTYLPLTEIWSWPDFRMDVPVLKRGALGRSPMRHALNQVALWNNRAYFSTARIQSPKTRAVICVDARTGAPIWARNLHPIPANHGYGAPSLTPAGRLFVCDLIPVSATIRADRKFLSGVNRLMVRYLSGVDGTDLAAYVDLAQSPPDGVPFAKRPPNVREGNILSPFLQTVVELTHSMPTELVTVGSRYGFDGFPKKPDYMAYQCPLVLGEELTAYTTNDGLFRWRPFEFDQWMAFFHSFGSSTTAATKQSLNYNGISPVSVPGGGGILIGSVAPLSMLALINPGAAPGNICLWHREIPYIYGMPVSAGASIVVGLGRPGGTQSLLALDAATGVTRWTYIPGDPPKPNEPIPLDSSTITAATLGYPYPDSPGVVARQGLVYAVVAGGLTALDQNSGKVIWRTPVDPTWLPRSLVASSTHLFLSVGIVPKTTKDFQAALLVYDLATGKPLWRMPTREFGSISLSNGLIYLADHGFVHAYAPAERTFHLAVDSDIPEDYQTPPPPEEEKILEGGLPSGDPATATPAGGPAKPELAPGEFPIPPIPSGVADATILRLEWSQGVEAMVARVRARRKVAPRSPLVLVLDWLDEQRTGLAGGNPGELPPLDAFKEACARLAAVGRPTYFEVMSDANVFLTRYPSRTEAVTELVRQTNEAVYAASLTTRVTLSYNAELLTGRYGYSSYLPFGRLSRPSRKDALRILTPLAVVDTLALTTYPRAAFRVHSSMPYTYLLQVRQLFPDHRLLLTEVGLPLNEKLPNREEDQRNFLTRLFAASYWTDARVIAYPRLSARNTTDAAEPFALRVGKAHRPALAEWVGVLGWRRVSRLSVTGPGKLPIAPPGAPGAEGTDLDAAPPAGDGDAAQR
jgi:hypothetical protein